MLLGHKLDLLPYKKVTYGEAIIVHETAFKFDQ